MKDTPEVEQVKETSAQTETEPKQADSGTEETKTLDEYIAPTKEQYEKALQSERSKAKYAILKDLGINSVESFKTEKAKYDEILKTNDERQSEIASLKTENEKLKTNLMMNELGVDDAYKDDLLVLAQAKAKDSMDLKSAAEEILNKNPNWKAHKEPTNFGTERSELKETTQSKLLEKYPWLK